MQNTSIVQSKLKRHKIAFTNEKGKLIIGKSKPNIGIILGLIVLPIFGALIISYFLIFSSLNEIGFRGGKLFLGVTFLVGTAIFNAKRLVRNGKVNKSLKTLDYKTIKITNGTTRQVFDAHNTQTFEYFIEHLDEHTCEGRLFLVDKEGKKHQLLGFQEENEKYLTNDLAWFAQYFIEHLALQSTEATQKQTQMNTNILKVNVL